MARSIRSFIAVDVTGEIRTKVRRLIDELRPESDCVRWVEPDAMHLTLKFLGEINYRDVAEVTRELQRATADIPPFLVEVCGTGAFPVPERPRTVWVGAGDGSADLVALHDAIENRLARLGFRSEHRRFRPHLTIGRVRGTDDGEPRLAAALAAQTQFRAGVVDVGEVVLYSSQLERQGPIYEPLSVVELRGR